MRVCRFSVRLAAASVLAAALVTIALPHRADADDEADRLLSRVSLLGKPSPWSLVQSLSRAIEEDRYIAYSKRGWNRKEKSGAYLRLGPAFDDDRRAGFYLGLEETSLRFLFKVDLGVSPK